MNIHVQWRSALCADAQAYYFPDKFTRYFRERYSISAVYRWRVVRVEGETEESIYIGEAEDIVRRIQRVRTPSRKGKKGDTNRRLNTIFQKHLPEGRKIVIDIADIEPFEINGVRFDTETLGDRFVRRTLEGILLVVAQASDRYELLNIAIDPVEKARRALAKLPPSAVRKIIKNYKLDESK